MLSPSTSDMAQTTTFWPKNASSRRPSLIDLRLNEPRYPKLPDIMKARKKSIDTIDATSMGVDITPRLKVLEVTEPPAREPGIKVANAAELIEKLKNEAGVI